MYTINYAFEVHPCLFDLNLAPFDAFFVFWAFFGMGSESKSLLGLSYVDYQLWSLKTSISFGF